jgi:phenylpropionate dioxygenase-like ring-hydroxylating dioxygenase large terminal subunit
MGHPGLRRLFGNSYVEDFEDRDGTQAYSELREEESSVWSERMYQKLLPEIDHLPPRLRRAWVYYGLFPGAVIQACPDVADCYQVLPSGPESCQLLTFRVALPDDRRAMRAARYLSDRIVRNVVNEDLALCRATGEGVKSGRYLGGYLSELESGVRIFQDKIRALIPVAGVMDRPRPGRVAALNAEIRTGQGSHEILS